MDDLQIEAIRLAMAPRAPEACRPEGVPAADPAMVERFEALMATEVDPANIAPPPPPVSSVPFADRVCRAFRAAQFRQLDSHVAIRRILDREGTVPLRQADLIRLQYEVANLAFQQDVVTKVIDRANQAVQSLFKNQ